MPDGYVRNMRFQRPLDELNFTKAILLAPGSQAGSRSSMPVVASPTMPVFRALVSAA